MCFLRSSLGEPNNCSGESSSLSLFKMPLEGAVRETSLLISLCRQTGLCFLSANVDGGDKTSLSPLSFWELSWDRTEPKPAPEWAAGEGKQLLRVAQHEEIHTDFKSHLIAINGGFNCHFLHGFMSGTDFYRYTYKWPKHSSSIQTAGLSFENPFFFLCFTLSKCTRTFFPLSVWFFISFSFGCLPWSGGGTAGGSVTLTRGVLDRNVTSLSFPFL